MGHAYAFMESVLPDLPMARAYSATSVPCPSCQAETGEACSGPRVCQERLDVALALARSGELPEALPAPVTPVELLDPAGCEQCTRGGATKAGRPIGCEVHRCHRTLRTGRRCRSVIKRGSRTCRAHGEEQRWN